MPGSVIGYVRDDITLTGIADARVSYQLGSTQSASNGYYSISAPDATFDITAERDKSIPPNPVPPPPNYYGKTAQVTVNNNIVVKDFYLRKMS